MNKKYEFTNKTIKVDGHLLHRIRAITDFGNVKVGDIGGYIESEKNLSITGTAWVYGRARVYDEAWVCGDACVYGDAKVYGNAKVYDEACVYGGAKVYGDACVYGDAWVYGAAKVYGKAKIFDDAKVYGKARVYGEACVYDDACVCGDALVYDEAWVCGKASLKTQINDTDYLIESIRVQTGIIPVNGEIIAYKQVRKNLSSLYDSEFVYRIGEVVSVPDAEESNKSCASGLHFSNANYWNGHVDVLHTTFIIAKIKLEDIITVQQGKIRCRKAFILGKYDIKVKEEK